MEAPTDPNETAETGETVAKGTLPTAETPFAPASTADAARSPETTWARPIDHLHARAAPGGHFAANLDGRLVVNPLQGFGQLWQRTYRVRLAGLNLSPAEVMAEWRANFPSFQPPENRFYAPGAGVKPGEVLFIDSTLVQGAGIGAMTEIASGVMVIYVDDVSFTVMTPQGFPVSGWNTFSTFEEDGSVVAQVQGLERATDPIYEFGYRFLGGEKKQDHTWSHVLRALAAHYGISGEVQAYKSCVDPHLQWGNAGNVVHNAAIRTLFYKLGAPLRWVRGPVHHSHP